MLTIYLKFKYKVIFILFMTTIEEGSIEFNSLLIMTIIIIIIKSGLIVFLLWKINKKKKEVGKIKLDILVSIFIYILVLLISRILLLLHDFVYAKFDYKTYHLMPQILLWKISFFLVFIGLSIFIYTIDKKALNFKFKGVFSYIEFIIAIVILIFPVNNLADVQILLWVVFFGTIICVIIPIFFLYLAKLSPANSDLRKISISLALSIVIYGVGGNLININFLLPVSIAFGSIVIIVLWLISLTMKTIGLIILAYGGTKIKV